MSKPDINREPVKVFNGLSVEQVRMVLAEIATTAVSLIQHCRDSAAASEQPDTAMQLHIAQMLSERIGLLADHARGGDIHGDHNHWIVGGCFRDEVVIGAGGGT